MPLFHPPLTMRGPGLEVQQSAEPLARVSARSRRRRCWRASSLGCGCGTPPSHPHSLSRGSAEVPHGLRCCHAVDGITRKHSSIGAGNVNDILALASVGVCNGVADTAARLHSRSGRWTLIHRTCVRTNGGWLALVVRPTGDAQQRESRQQDGQYDPRKLHSIPHRSADGSCNYHGGVPSDHQVNIMPLLTK